MLGAPTAPKVQNAGALTGPSLALDRDNGTAELEFTSTGIDLDSEAGRHLQEEGLVPEEWEIVTARTGRWTMANGEEGRTARYTYRRVENRAANLEETLEWLATFSPKPHIYERSAGALGLIFALGDMQFGKVDGDGVDGTLARCVEFIDRAVRICERNMTAGAGYSEVIVAWMGDHGEGFVSQDGANIWRTTLTNTEQQRLTRRVMTYAAEKFAEVVPVGVKLSMVAVPGNHGDTIRIKGKGTTRYDDSYDTEALISLADAVEMSEREELKRINFYVPENDEIVVVLDVAGTRTVFSHGHFHRPGRALDWLTGQAFDKSSPMRDADLLIEGHLHHLHADKRNGTVFIGVPAVESESTWFRHRTGITGDPGAVLITTGGGIVPHWDVIE